MKRLKSVLFCILLAMLYSGLQMLSGAAVGFLYFLTGSDRSAIEGAIQHHAFPIQISAALLFIVPVGIYLKRSKEKIWADEKREKTPKFWISFVLLAVSFSVLWTVLTRDFTFENNELIRDGVDYYSSVSPVLGYFLMILSVLIAAPIVEELLYRRMMIPLLGEHFSDGMAILISSLIFGAIHIFAGGMLLGVGAFLIGLIFGWIYVHTGGNFTVVASSHILANCAEYILMPIPKNVHIPFALVLFVFSVLCIGVVIAPDRKKR